MSAWNRLRCLGFATLAGGLLAVQPARADDLVRVGMLPGSGATTASSEDQKALQIYLGDAMGVPVKLVTPKDYEATIAGLGNGSFDFAILGAVGYAKAHLKFGAQALVQREADKQFHSLFITQADSPIQGLGDLKGKRFAFGDMVSTSGHVMPYRAMLDAGLIPEKDLEWTRYTGSHAATVQAVAAGVADAGSADETVFRSMVAEHKVDGAKLRVFYTTPPFVDYVWAARKDIDAETRKKFVEAFLALTPGRDDKLLGVLRATRYAVANEEEYKTIEELSVKLALF